MVPFACGLTCSAAMLKHSGRGTSSSYLPLLPNDPTQPEKPHLDHSAFTGPLWRRRILAREMPPRGAVQ